mmetsp:Transcript_68295/g.176058  ORF Transcript_68295/g.176058 Transcript_68295/m.176058 type:complete len:219 (+) Transcript_68295:375-1031(+)
MLAAREPGLALADCQGAAAVFPVLGAVLVVLTLRWCALVWNSVDAPDQLGYDFEVVEADAGHHVVTADEALHEGLARVPLCFGFALPCCRLVQHRWRREADAAQLQWICPFLGCLRKDVRGDRSSTGTEAVPSNQEVVALRCEEVPEQRRVPLYHELRCAQHPGMGDEAIPAMLLIRLLLLRSQVCEHVGRGLRAADREDVGGLREGQQPSCLLQDLA